MGEIATWSAVKTKVGLGKTGSDCPTKAELLALSPTGTGDNYVALELSNASSYGNNECVQLADIHKVTYKYTYTIQNPTLTFPAIGGASTPSVFGTSSTKQKYLDGVAQGDPILVSEDYTLPDWITIKNGTYMATENLALSQRSNTITLTQAESGKTVQGTFTQAAATQSWEYTFEVPSALSFDATGETKTFSVSSYKQEYRNGHTYGSEVALSYTRTNDNGNVTGEGTTITMGNNTSELNRSGTVTLVQSETNKSKTITCYQRAGSKTYSDITITTYPTCDDIPASGGSVSAFSTAPEYSQTWGWNGSTTGGGTITSGASIKYGDPISASSLGTKQANRSKIGTLDSTLSLNGKNINVSAYVYQQANTYKYKDLPSTLEIAADKYTFGSDGGSAVVNVKELIKTEYTYTSGSIEIRTVKAAPWSPRISISVPNGLTYLKILDGNYLVNIQVACEKNTSGVDRSFNMDITFLNTNPRQEYQVTFTQAAGAIEVNTKYCFSDAKESFDGTVLIDRTYDASYQQQSIRIYSYALKTVNGVVQRSYITPTIGLFSSKWLSAGIDHAGANDGEPYAELRLDMANNNTTSPRTITLELTQLESNKVVTVQITQRGI